jgi:hypothetical protein
MLEVCISVDAIRHTMLPNCKLLLSCISSLKVRAVAECQAIAGTARFYREGFRTGWAGLWKVGMVEGYHDRGHTSYS